MAEDSSRNGSHGHRRRDTTSSRPHSQKKDSPRQGLRIFIGTANLGSALPDTDSLSAWIPHHGKVNHVLNNVKTSSIVVPKEKWNGIDTHGKIEVIAIGIQEGVPGSNIITATGLTAKLTGISVKERNVFSKALGDFGKPVDGALSRVNEMIATGVKGANAEYGGTKKLIDMVTSHVGEDYTLMNEYQRGEMVLYLFVRNDLASASSITEVQAENCGIGSIMANKGGIATMLTIGSTRLSFLSVHLTAGEGMLNYQQRNANMEKILQGTNDPTQSSHHAFVFGDMNYRFSLPPSSKGTEPTKEENMFVCQRIIAQKDWISMNQNDELQRALRDKEILVGFQTPPLRTFPTFKCERKEGVTYDFKRVPSHTDRILWKSNEDKETPINIVPLVYEPISKFSTSDHKPVRALFFLPNRPSLKLDPEKTTLYITLKGFKCKGLKPAADLLYSDTDTYLKFRCEPTFLEKKSSNGKKRTVTVKTSDRPSWPREEIKFQINVTSEDEVYGAYLYLQCMHKHPMSGDSVLGTVILDLEHIVRVSLGVEKWNDEVERHFLRNGKEVGKLFCGMNIRWGKIHNSHQPSDQPKVVPPSSSHGCASSAEKTPRMESSEKNLSRYLKKLGLPHGLLSIVLQNYHACEKSYWFIDNSASMQTRDSHLMGDNSESVQVSRWEELCECVCFHTKLSAKCRLPTNFCLMNAAGFSSGPQQFSVCCSKQSDVASEIEQAKNIMMTTTPNMPRSPLIQCISDFKKKISRDASLLSSQGKHVTLVMCTQGLPTDQTGQTELAALRQFKHNLYSLSKLPVKIVFRLCTNDDNIMHLYNSLDAKLDNCDVLDDFFSEALEVYLHNPWLCYGLGLHRLREAGLAWGLIDDLDTRSLDLDEIHQFCNQFFLGENKKGSDLPHPKDWEKFKQSLSELMKKEKLQWNPVRKKSTAWISLTKLENMHQHAQGRGKNTQTPGDSSNSSHHKGQHRKQPQSSSKANSMEPLSKDSTLETVLQCWSHQPPRYKRLYPLHQLLVSIVDVFPPTNTKVESHDYFNKWNPISEEAFSENGDELMALLKRAMRKAKLFIHPDKLPKDLTENQSHLFRTIWDVIIESEDATLK
eukprot:CAMPEP_0172299274 /NCGR_PEP_ID=MMETSP1058-20130122/1631_1 /TAXON_ID=83371 /ORGANISM="Detonula confervacea, Strain CCMP 353" /LENGTH=1098 /DNA_ID=CAMNT_0013008681 /DNA_START=29 /DNA_END=3325 /DNA_ORIENTATION=-